MFFLASRTVMTSSNGNWVRHCTRIPSPWFAHVGTWRDAVGDKGAFYRDPGCLNWILP